MAFVRDRIFILPINAEQSFMFSFKIIRSWRSNDDQRILVMQATNLVVLNSTINHHKAIILKRRHGF